MNIIDDRYFFYVNIDLLLIKKIDLIDGDITNIRFEKDSHSESYYYSNRGFLAANNEYLVYAYLYKNQIDIYNASDLTLYKRLITPKDGMSFEQGERFSVPYNYYINLVTTLEYIYAYKVDAKSRHLLEIYDYDGNPIMKYVLEVPLPLFTVDESNRILAGFNYNDEDHFYVYELNFLDNN